MGKKGNKDNWLARQTKKLAAFLHQRYIGTFILVKSAAVWFPFLFTLLGCRLQLLETVDESVQLTILGKICLIFVGGYVTVCNLALLYDERTNGKYTKLNSLYKEEQERNTVLTDLKESVNVVSDSKLRTLIDRIDHYLDIPFERPPEIISDPKRQLDIIADELSGKMSHLLKFDQQQYGSGAIHTSIFYRFPQEEDASWQCATQLRGLSIPELLQRRGSQQSTFSYLLENRGNVIFENSKQFAYEEGYYIPDSEDCYDKDKKLKGSIACFHQKIMDRKGKLIVDFVINITSYSRRFIENSDSNRLVKDTENAITHVLMPGFVVQTKTELCLLYLNYLHNLRDPRKNEMTLHLKKVSISKSEGYPIIFSLNEKNKETRIKSDDE